MKRRSIIRQMAAMSAMLICFTGCARQATEQTTPTGAATAESKQTSVRLSSEEADAAEPNIAAAPDGTLYAVWVEHTRGYAGDLRLAHLDTDGKLIGETVRVNPVAGEAMAWLGDAPTIIVAPDGTVYIGWTRRIATLSEGEHGNDLYLSASRDAGKSFAAPVRVNDDAKPAAHGMHSLAISADNRIYVAWLDERNPQTFSAYANDEQRNLPQSQMSARLVKVHEGGATHEGKDKQADTSRNNAKSSGHKMEGNSEVFTAYSTDGGRSFSTNQRIAINVCPCCKTALAVASDNRVYVGWRQVLPGDFRHIAVASSINGGKTYSAPSIVSDDRWQIAGCPVSGAALNVIGDGRLRVLWYTAGEAGDAGLYFAESIDHGRTFSPRQLFAAGAMRGTPVIVGAGNGTVAIWESNTDGITHTRLEAFPSPNGKPKAFIVGGELPAATTQIGGRNYVLHIGKKNNLRGVWITQPVTTLVQNDLRKMI